MHSVNDFSCFIRTIYKETNYTNQDEFTVALFKSGNAELHLPVTTANNWLKEKEGKASKAYTKAFKEAKTFRPLPFDDDSFLTFLKDNIKGWEALRDNFATQRMDTDKNSRIDFTAVDEDEFLRSIMIQFKALVGLPYKKKAIIQIFDMFFRDICNTGMEKFIDAEPAVSYTYCEVEDVEVDSDEVSARFDEALKPFGIEFDESDDEDEEDEDGEDEDEDEDEENNCIVIDSATISLDVSLIDILESFLTAIEKSFSSIPPEVQGQITRQEDSYIKKICDFVKTLKTHSWLISQMTIHDENIWTAANEMFTVLYCKTLASRHPRIKKQYAEIRDIYNSLVK